MCVCMLYKTLKNFINAATRYQCQDYIDKTNLKVHIKLTTRLLQT